MIPMTVVHALLYGSEVGVWGPACLALCQRCRSRPTLCVFCPALPSWGRPNMHHHLTLMFLFLCSFCLGFAKSVKALVFRAILSLVQLFQSLPEYMELCWAVRSPIALSVAGLPVCCASPREGSSCRWYLHFFPFFWRQKWCHTRAAVTFRDAILLSSWLAFAADKRLRDSFVCNTIPSKMITVVNVIYFQHNFCK